jgi:hypothetical protein
MHIPRILHAIWLGEKPMPEASRKNLENWRRLHPGWELCILWSEAEAQKQLMRWREFDMRSVLARQTSYAAKSDILRLLILKHVGGVYIDGDMEPVKAIDPLIALAETVGGGCFVGWEQTNERINNAVIGAAPGHGAITDALDNLRIHLADPATNLRDAAYATGPFYLNSIWWHDKRVFKFPREVFYPYDWHEPWRASEHWGPDTFAVHRWDASWIDETQHKPRELRTPLGIVMVGIDLQDDAPRGQLVWGSHIAQSADDRSRQYSFVWDVVPGITETLPRAIQMLRDPRRILFAPYDHVLDRNTCEAHALLPHDCIGATRHRLFSAAKLFPREHRRAKAFPFDVFSAHGLETQRDITNTEADIQEVFSISRDLLLDVLTPWPEALSGKKTWPEFARALVKLATPYARVCFTYKTRTTKLCQHPVLENCHEQRPLPLPYY